LYRRPDSTFEIGSALRGLGEGIHSFSGLPQEGAHLLADLSEATGRRARLAILMNRRVFYMEKRPNVDPVTTFSLAATLPAYATAVGKVLLAFTPPRSVAHIVRPMVAFTPHTIDSMERLYRELHVIRSQGFAISSEEHFAGDRRNMRADRRRSGNSIFDSVVARRFWIALQHEQDIFDSHECAPFAGFQHYSNRTAARFDLTQMRPVGVSQPGPQ